MISPTRTKSVFVGLTLLSSVVVSLSGSAEEAQPAPTTPVAPTTPTTAVSETKPRFVFALSTDKPKYTLGEQVILHVALTNNNSKGFISAGGTDNLMRAFDLKVTDAQGRTVPLTTYGTFLTSPDHLKAGKRRAGGTVFDIIIAGETSTLSFPLNGFFDVSSMTTYTVSATRQGLGELKDGKPTALTAKATFQVEGISIKVTKSGLDGAEAYRRFSESGTK